MFLKIYKEGEIWFADIHAEENGLGEEHFSGRFKEVWEAVKNWVDEPILY